MSGHSHDTHHSSEQKPVAFTVPFYLAVATLLFLFFFLSLCDPKSHHEAAGHGAEAVSGAANEHHAMPAATEAPEAVVTEEHTAEPAKTEPAAQEAHH